MIYLDACFVACWKKFLEIREKYENCNSHRFKIDAWTFQRIGWFQYDVRYVLKYRHVFYSVNIIWCLHLIRCTLLFSDRTFYLHCTTFLKNTAKFVVWNNPSSYWLITRYRFSKKCWYPFFWFFVCLSRQ